MIILITDKIWDNSKELPALATNSMFVEENEGYAIYHLMLKAVMIETARKLITNDYKSKDYKNDKTEAARLYALMRGIQLQCLHPYSMRINADFLYHYGVI